MNRVFLLSPASCSGVRARWILRKNSRSEMAERLKSGEGVPLGEVFSFLSALYFRGKLAYARAFARPANGGAGILVITPSRGLVAAESAVRLSTLRGFARVPINKKHRLYRRALARGVKALAAEIGPECEVVLLGSIATGKYLDILTEVLGDRLRVPSEFIGMGDMRRGALLLRCVKENRELEYLTAASAVSVLTRGKLRARANSENAGRRMPWRIG